MPFVTVHLPVAEFVGAWVLDLIGVAAVVALAAYVIFLRPPRGGQRRHPSAVNEVPLSSKPVPPTRTLVPVVWDREAEREAARRPRVQTIVRASDALRDFLDWVEQDKANLRIFEQENPDLMRRFRHAVQSVAKGNT